MAANSGHSDSVTKRSDRRGFRPSVYAAATSSETAIEGWLAKQAQGAGRKLLNAVSSLARGARPSSGGGGPPPAPPASVTPGIHARGWELLKSQPVRVKVAGLAAMQGLARAAEEHRLLGAAEEARDATWQRRYFVARGHYLVYYLSQEKGDKIEAAIDLDHVTKIEYAGGGAATPEARAPTERAFALVFGLEDGRIPLRAPTAELAAHWVHVLRGLMASSGAAAAARMLEPTPRSPGEFFGGGKRASTSSLGDLVDEQVESDDDSGASGRDDEEPPPPGPPPGGTADFRFRNAKASVHVGPPPGGPPPGVGPPPGGPPPDNDDDAEGRPLRRSRTLNEAQIAEQEAQEFIREMRASRKEDLAARALAATEIERMARGSAARHGRTSNETANRALQELMHLKGSGEFLPPRRGSHADGAAIGRPGGGGGGGTGGAAALRGSWKPDFDRWMQEDPQMEALGRDMAEMTLGETLVMITNQRITISGRDPKDKVFAYEARRVPGVDAADAPVVLDVQSVPDARKGRVMALFDGPNSVVLRFTMGTKMDVMALQRV